MIFYIHGFCLVWSQRVISNKFNYINDYEKSSCIDIYQHISLITLYILQIVHKFPFITCNGFVLNVTTSQKVTKSSTKSPPSQQFMTITHPYKPICLLQRGMAWIFVWFEFHNMTLYIAIEIWYLQCWLAYGTHF